MASQSRKDLGLDGGSWVSQYSGLKRMEDGATPRKLLGRRASTGNLRETTDAWSSDEDKVQLSPSAALRDYGSVGFSEMSHWLWLDFSVPTKSPVAKLIRKNMRSHSFDCLADERLVEETLDAEEQKGSPKRAPREEIVGFSRMVAQVLAPLGEGSLLAAVFTLVSSAMGAGCLSLPFMLKRSGVVLGLLMLAVGALLAHLSLVVLMSCARYTESESMARLVTTAGGGKHTGKVVDVVIAIYGIAAVLCYLMFIGDFFSGIAKSPMLGLEVSRETLILVISVFVVWPLSLPRSLSALRHVCVLSVGAICLTAVVVASKAPGFMISGDEAKSGDADGWEINWWNSDPVSALQSFSIALFAFAAHTNAVPVATSLKQADGASIWKVSLYSVCIELVFYALMGIGGYLSFRDSTEQNIILNYPNDDFLMFLIRCVYGVVVCLGAPINLSPAASSILGLISCERNTSWALHCGVVTVIIIICVIVALASEQIADVIGLIGASFGTLIVLAWPTMIYGKALFDLHPPCLASFIYYSLGFASLFGFAAFSVQAYAAWS